MLIIFQEGVEIKNTGSTNISKKKRKSYAEKSMLYGQFVKVKMFIMCSVTYRDHFSVVCLAVSQSVTLLYYSL